MILKTCRELSQYFRRFAGDTRGTITIEAIVYLPFLAFCTVTSVMFYDAYRTDSLGEKATYTLGDMLSRETDYITPAYVDSAKSLMNFLTESEAGENTIRVSVVSYHEATDSYSVEWSQVRGPHVSVLDTTEITGGPDNLPNMVDGEQLIVIDTYLDYVWPLAVGFDDITMEARVFTRPRFAPQLVWSES